MGCCEVGLSRRAGKGQARFFRPSAGFSFTFTATGVSWPATSENLIADGILPNPVERTLLTTGVLSFAIDSLYENGRRIDTPELAITYMA